MKRNFSTATRVFRLCCHFFDFSDIYRLKYFQAMKLTSKSCIFLRLRLACHLDIGFRFRTIKSSSSHWRGTNSIGSSPELSAFAASCRFRKVAWLLVLQIPALLVQNKTHMVNMDEAPNFHKMLKPELKLNTREAMVQKLLTRKLLLFCCSMMASLVLFSLF